MREGFSAKDQERGDLRWQCSFTLMVMRTGIIAAFDDGMVPFIQSRPDVKLVGGVTLSPNGYAADRLKRIFAENLSKQLEVGPADAS